MTLLSKLYPKYWKLIPKRWMNEDGTVEVDTYRIGELFPVSDNSGRLIHARKKLLVPGTRTGGKSMYDDVKEARDTLTGWLEDNKVEVQEQPQKSASPAGFKGPFVKVET